MNNLFLLVQGRVNASSVYKIFSGLNGFMTFFVILSLYSRERFFSMMDDIQFTFLVYHNKHENIVL